MNQSTRDKLKKIWYNIRYFSLRKNWIIRSFHKLYYDSQLVGGTWRNTFYMGFEIQKCPLDLWIYQEILYEIKPDLIIEAGTAFGGSAYYMATLCDHIGQGKIVTIDIEKRGEMPKHPRIEYIIGSSISDEVISKLEVQVKKSKKVIVILDSNHTRDHVFAELEKYSKFVSSGSYLIVEDSNVNGNPVFYAHGPGPMEAINAFLKNNKEYKVDKSKEKFFLTFNPKGYLKKIS